jgi:hypothetical protein
MGRNLAILACGAYYLPNRKPYCGRQKSNIRAEPGCISLGKLLQWKPAPAFSGSNREDIMRRKVSRIVDAADDQRSRGAEVQSGDTQGLSKTEQGDSESVEELAADGQAFEAEAVSGVEDAADPDVHEVETREVPEDDVPHEYDDQ